jgi:hypothetical protein
MTQSYEIKIKCTRCKKEVQSKLVMERMTIIDSPGIMLFDWPDGPQCDKCLTRKDGVGPASELFVEGGQVKIKK